MARVVTGSTSPFSFEARRVEKPWGYELIWADTDRYVGKVLFVRAGQALSLQYHERKDEAWLVQGGLAKFFVKPTVPAVVRPLRNYVLNLEYGNDGDVDAPLIGQPDVPERRTSLERFTDDDVGQEPVVTTLDNDAGPATANGG